MMTNILNTYPTKHIHNPEADAVGPYIRSPGSVIPPSSFDDAFREISTWPGYTPTPLLELSGLAEELGIDTVHRKDEAPRFGLGSFKARGGAYAVSLFLREIIKRETGKSVSTQSLMSGEFSALTQTLTVCSATDGNHGRSVAWGAQMFGCRCIIFVPHHASQGRIDAIASYSADVIVHDANYDETVRHCAREADAKDWTVISDTSYEG